MKFHIAKLYSLQKPEFTDIIMNKELIRENFNYVGIQTISIDSYIHVLKSQRMIGRRLISFLKKEYRIQ